MLEIFLSKYAVLVFFIACILYLPVQRLRLNREVARLGGRAPLVEGGFLGTLGPLLSPLTILPRRLSKFRYLLHTQCSQAFPGIHRP